MKRFIIDTVACYNNNYNNNLYKTYKKRKNYFLKKITIRIL